MPLLLFVACRDEQGAAEKPWFDIQGDLGEIGFDQPLGIDVRPANAKTRRGEISWKQVSGPALRDLQPTERGFHLTARTPKLRDLVASPLPWGIVPLSPNTRGEAILEAEWRGAGSPPVRRRVTLTAAARARGLPNVPVHQRLYLSADDWSVKEAPPGDSTALEPHDGITAFTPDRAGTWTLADRNGRVLRLQAGRYDDTPLDCGRAACHQAIAESAQATPMTWALARRLEAGASGSSIACAIACHATGEPGTNDGGFADVAGDLGVPLSLEGSHDVSQLPRPLRRLGSVGCLACHGPGALPEVSARWSILRSDVCAFCHDAPPRYGHVAGWRSSAMAHADRDPEARANAKCTSCHTTWGFLEQAAPAAAGLPDRRPPDDAGDVGIACAACHETHGAPHTAPGTTTALLREPQLPAILDGVPELAHSRSAVCFGCHAPDAQSSLPRASAAAIFAGRGGLDPETGARLTGPAPHLAVTGGCVGCHDAGPAGLERGSNHAFAANSKRCVPCHATPPASSSALIGEARALWQKLRDLRVVERAPTEAESRPQHAADFVRVTAPRPLARAAWDIALLLEDRAATVHNPSYAARLLQTSRAAIERSALRPHDPPGAAPERRP